MELNKAHWIGIIAALVIMLSSLFFLGTNLFPFIIGIGLFIGLSPFIFSLIYEAKIANEKEEMFLELSRNLVESVKTGTPISKSIINMKDKPYGVLSKHVKKLANQISLGIPLNSAFQTFARDVNNKTVSRAITLIGQAEKAGGDIGEILESVADAVSMSDKLKKERKAVISTLTVQGYIIFFVFIVIILVMQFKILPMVSGISDLGGVQGLNVGISGTTDVGLEEISSAFLWLLLIQGLFSGLIIGKLAEGSVKPGIKHSFILMLVSFLASSAGNILWG